MRYCIWNNKGGVGKTFLTYCLAVEYALRYPKKTVAVVDMCPQANVSEMLLGGNGLGEKNLSTFYKERRTIASYIVDRLKGGWTSRLGREIDYFVKIHDFNSNLPANLYLLPGDFDLDNCAEVLDYIASSPITRAAWASSRQFLSEIISVFEDRQKQPITLFIDTNPSFANYTQAGVIAADRLIVPCTADYASIRGVYNIFYRIFGVKEVNGYVGESDVTTFHSKALTSGVILPKIHSFLLNRSRSHRRDASRAYESYTLEIKKIIRGLVKKHKDCFALRAGKYAFNVKDSNTLSAVLNYNGLRPSALQNKEYDVYDGSARVNMSQVSGFLDDIAKIVALL